MKRILPPLALDAARRAKSLLDAARYHAGGRVPWSAGYADEKWRVVFGALRDERLLEAFRRGTALPPGYAVGIDERAVEYPWICARLPPGPGRVLDAGSVLNNPRLMRTPPLDAKKLDIVTLAPEEGCYWGLGASYVFDDLRALPFRDALYDGVVCVSTLEHVGFDNVGYTGKELHREADPLAFLAAMAEFRRVLKPGGTLLLTVPYGKLVRVAVGQQFDRELLDLAIRAFGEAASTRTTFYAYDRRGWRLASDEECRGLEFVRWRAVRPWPRPLPVEPDLAASARSVACVEITR